jgi:hypothetical protein
MNILGRLKKMTGDLVGGVGSAVGGVTQGVGETVSGVGDAVTGVGGAVSAVTQPTPPALTHESGVSTSEFKMTAIKSALLAVFGLMAAFGVVVPKAFQGVVLGTVPIAISVLGGAYAISRGIRKHGSA